MAYLKLSFAKRGLKAGETPQSFFEHVRGDYAFLLESGEAQGSDRAGGSGSGRYSYIGYDPFLFAWSQKGVSEFQQRKNFCGAKKSGVKQMAEGDALDFLRGLMEKYVYKGSAPVPFYGGAAGFFSYDFGCGFAGVKQKVFDDAEVPDFCFSFVDKVIAFDHEKNEVYFLALAETDAAAERKVKEVEADLAKPVLLYGKGKTGVIASNISKKQYFEKIETIKKLLTDGETYQVNFSQRFSGESTMDPYAAYKKLAQKSPVPFACYLQYPEFAVASSSPELLLRKRKSKVETWPIKGTVARGKTQAEDRKLEAELLNSAKDEAELNMIVDLERNDLGKVCVPGTVAVAEHRAVQKLSNVIHTYSRVEGKLDQKKDIFDLLRAVFPGGSITGCPKKRTLQIIDKLEDFRRGVYTGSAGFINFSGDGDFNILIRTMFFKDNKVTFHSGGGIVIDSVAEKEFEETLLKSSAMRDVLAAASAA